jgi:hypothetical protein
MTTMTTLTISLDEARLQQLQESARRLGMTVEDLARQSIEAFLDTDPEFVAAARRVLTENAELYRRLAR